MTVNRRRYLFLSLSLFLSLQVYFWQYDPPSYSSYIIGFGVGKYRKHSLDNHCQWGGGGVVFNFEGLKFPRGGGHKVSKGVANAPPTRHPLNEALSPPPSCTFSMKNG